MSTASEPKFFLVNAEMLPEIFIKVAKAKELLETGEAQTVAEAAALVDISRSAFYKYKDAITPFQDLQRGRIITFHIALRDKMGVLSSVLAVFAGSGANILTINQNIPVKGKAFVSVSARSENMSIEIDELLKRLFEVQGVIKIDSIVG